MKRRSRSDDSVVTKSLDEVDYGAVFREFGKKFKQIVDESYPLSPPQGGAEELWYQTFFARVLIIQDKNVTPSIFNILFFSFTSHFLS